MLAMLLCGLFPAITTPFYPDGAVYFRKLEHNVGRYAKTPLTGMVVLGSTGEAVMLSDAEKRDVLKCAIGSAIEEKVMLAGTGAESAIETLRLSEYAAELGYDVALVRTPHYYKRQTTPENMLAFYRFIADRSPLPVLVYNFPQATGYDMPVDVVAQLAKHPNLIGIKESSGSIEKIKGIVEATKSIKRIVTVTDHFEPVTGRMIKQASTTQDEELISIAALQGSEIASPKPSLSSVDVVGKLRTRQKEVGFQVLSGAAHKLNASLEAGAVGAILAFASAAPTACYEIYAAFKGNDKSVAEERQQRIVRAAERIAVELSIPGIKYAMDLNGYYGGNGRLPMLPLTAETKREIEELMADIKS